MLGEGFASSISFGDKLIYALLIQRCPGSWRMYLIHRPFSLVFLSNDEEKRMPMQQWNPLNSFLWGKG
jgi:hypothetical protein